MSHAAPEILFFTYMSSVNLHNILMNLFRDEQFIDLNNSASDEQLSRNRTEVQISLLE